MEQRQIGASELKILPVMLGGNVFGWTADAATSFAVLDAFVDAGFNAIDTADVYSNWVPGHTGGESETIVGAWLKARGRRDRVVVATKVGGLATDWSRGYLSASHIVKTVEESLTRLQTDYIDLYQSHKDDPATPLDETLTAYERLIESGKVRVIGASHYEAPRLIETSDISRDRGLPRYDSLQIRYSLCERNELEGDTQSACIARGISVLCYSALAKGFLTGKFLTVSDCSGSPWEKFLKPYLNDRGMRILGALKVVALQQDATPGEIALAWLLTRPAVAAAIVAANTVEQLNELLRFPSLKLDQSQIDLLSAASALAPGEDKAANS